MKKYIITLSLLLTALLPSRAQQLQNTYWNVYRPDGSFFEYFHFGVDTLFFSADNVTYTHRSIYTENGNSFSLYDPSSWPGQCSQSTGQYTFTISNDTLDFTLIYDDCPGGRGTVLDTYIFVRFSPTGIETLTKNSALYIYPNPSLNGIFNVYADESYKVIVWNTQGSKVFEGSGLPGEQTSSINLNHLSQGVYFLQLKDEHGIKTYKIVR